MNEIFGFPYLFLFLGLSLAALFVVYHIFRYSLLRRNAVWGTVVFISGFGFLAIINAILFSRIDWSAIGRAASGSPF